MPDLRDEKDYPVDELVEGALLECPFCGLKLTLHGHMLQEVQEQIGKLKAATSRRTMKAKGATLHMIPEDRNPYEYAKELGGFYAVGFYVEEGFERSSK